MIHFTQQNSIFDNQQVMSYPLDKEYMDSLEFNIECLLHNSKSNSNSNVKKDPHS